MTGSRAIHLTTGPEAIEVRAEGGGPPVIRGYAAIFDSPTTITQSYSAYNEVVAKGAFRKTLLYNHNPDNVLGRTKSGTLRLEEDSVGLRYEVQVPDTSWGRDLVELIRRGDVSQSSFAFAPVSQEWTRAQTTEELDTRTLKEVKLYDVSVVTYPAYEDTVASLRSASTRELVALGRLARGQQLDDDDIEQLRMIKDRIDDHLVEEAPVEDHVSGEPAPSHSIDTLKLRLRLMNALSS
jgi:HK97 family phage prohead protease